MKKKHSLAPILVVCLREGGRDGGERREGDEAHSEASSPCVRLPPLNIGTSASQLRATQRGAR